MKYCKYCNQDKPFDPTIENRYKANGFYDQRCWDCWNSAKNAKQAIYRSTPEGKAYNSKTACATASKNRGVKRASNMVYYTAKLMREMPWTEHAEIRKVYKEAARLKLVVDHIIPLQGTDVSGLHVLANLQMGAKTHRFGSFCDCDVNRSQKFPEGARIYILK